MSTTNTSNSGGVFRGRFINFRLTDLNKPIYWPETMILHYSEYYRLIQNCPPPHQKPNKSRDHEFEKDLLDFANHFRNNLTDEVSAFSSTNGPKYNICNGLIAVYSYDRLLVAPPNVIWENTLLCLGYSRDESLPVPFSNGEAYYDKFRDTLHAIW